MKRTGLSQRPMDYSTSFRTRNFAQPLTREQLRRPLWSTAFSRRSWTSWKVRSLVYISVFFVSIHLYAQRFRDWFISHYLFAAIRPSDDQYSYHKSCHFFSRWSWNDCWFKEATIWQPFRSIMEVFESNSSLWWTSLQPISTPELGAYQHRFRKLFFDNEKRKLRNHLPKTHT